MFQIEAAKAADVLEVKRVLSETWLDAYGSFLSPETIERVTAVWHAPERLRAEVQNPGIFFAIAKDGEGNIVGLVTANEASDDVVIITRLYVLPTYQRQGIGGRLLAETMKVFATARRLRLEVEVENKRGLAFYSKQGFIEIGRRQEVVLDDVLQVVEMEKQLT